MHRHASRKARTAAGPDLGRRVARSEVEVVCMRCASRLERADVEPRDSQRPPRGARSSRVSRPNVLVRIDETLDAILRHELDERREVLDVGLVVYTTRSGWRESQSIRQNQRERTGPRARATPR